MYKIAILGCENSHADAFIDLVREGKYPDAEVVGVYTEYADAAERMMTKYGIENAASADAFVGAVDGIMVTARHGDNHLRYALPYVESGIPMFIDKPITASVEDAAEMMQLFAAHGVRFCGGSSCKHAAAIRELRAVAGGAEKHYGGNLRAPVSMKNDYGNIWFYSQHLVQMMQEIFGYYPLTVSATARDNSVYAVFGYEGFDVSAAFLDGSYAYSAEVYTEKNTEFRTVAVDSTLYAYEMDEFYALLHGGESVCSSSDFIAPVYVIDALIRAVQSGRTESVVPIPKEVK